MKNIMITGVNGFVGHHLARELKDRGNHVIGVGTQPEKATNLADYVDDYYSCDLTDAAAVATLPLEAVDSVVNLAGLANNGESYSKPDLYMRVNTGVLETLGQRLMAVGKIDTRVLAISTGAIYSPDQSMPITEDSKLTDNPSPYIESKAAMEEIGRGLADKGLDCVIVRPFNHIGPGQETGFLLPDLTEQVRHSIETGSDIVVGNLNTKRDYTDVRDVVNAYADLCLSDKLEHSLYNICSGKSVSGQELLMLVLGSIAKTNKPRIVVDPAKIRPNDPPEIVGSYSRLEKDINWRPRIPLEKTVADFLAG